MLAVAPCCLLLALPNAGANENDRFHQSLLRPKLEGLSGWFKGKGGGEASHLWSREMLPGVPKQWTLRGRNYMEIRQYKLLNPHRPDLGLEGRYTRQIEWNPEGQSGEMRIAQQGLAVVGHSAELSPLAGAWVRVKENRGQLRFISVSQDREHTHSRRMTAPLSALYGRLGLPSGVPAALAVDPLLEGRYTAFNGFA